MNMSKAIITLYATLVFSGQAIAQDKLDILQVFDQFLLANHAASKCIKPDAETLGKFLGNFQIVIIRATEEVQKRNPNSTKQEAQQIMKAQSDSQNRRVTEIVQSTGCTDPRIQDLLKRFQMQASLKL